MKKTAKRQYGWVKDSRRALFDYCRKIDPQDFVRQNTSFGRGGSIRNLLVHIANTYQFWIAGTALSQNVVYPKFDDIPDLQSAVRLFEEIDAFMETFIESIDERSIDYELDGVKSTASALKLYTHAITHEFHHKGQILSISRHLGYTPADTDIMR